DEYNVVLADNGEEALEALRKLQDTISLVLLDLVMPRMDGHQVLREMSKDKVLSTIPVIVLTSESSTEVTTLDLGAADFIAKPYESPDVILARISKTIQLYESIKNISEANKDNAGNSLLSDMGEAINEGQFVVYYQPKYAIQGEEPVLSSAEALVRWNHPELGMINPEYFIGVFENNGMIHELDHFVWRQAAKQIKDWKAELGSSVPISVNVSRIDLLDTAFVNDICKIVEEEEIETNELMLEITESAYTEDSESIISTVQHLRELGFHIEMDDFGTGYSSLNMISSLPIDILKLDIGFVRHIHENDKDYRMVEIILEMAKLLEVKVVAEGVEEKAQYELLKKAGVDVVQGYYFSKPLPAEEFGQLVKEL
ncbi:MAG: EAL domain-containing response regulator, partial [Pseudobutyrivibrio sp.]|nr:EAL domain-containing response regulator [Pseudobutyrivibrio sp.]